MNKKKPMEIIKVNDVWKLCDFSITATAAFHSGEEKKNQCGGSIIATVVPPLLCFFPSHNEHAEPTQSPHLCVISHSDPHLQMRDDDDSVGVCVTSEKQSWQVTVSSRRRWFLQIVFVILETRSKLLNLLVNMCTEYVVGEKLKARHQNVPARPGISPAQRR